MPNCSNVLNTKQSLLVFHFWPRNLLISFSSSRSFAQWTLELCLFDINIVKRKPLFEEYVFILVNGYICFFFRRQRMDIVVHSWFFALTAFGNSIALSSAQRFRTKIAQKGQQVAPKINMLNLHCLTIASLGQRQCSADWSSCLILSAWTCFQYQRERPLGFHENSEEFLPSCSANLVLWSKWSSKIGL